MTLVDNIVHHVGDVIRRVKTSKKTFCAGDLIFVLPKHIGAVSIRPRRMAICLSGTITWENAFGCTRGLEVYFPDVGDVCLVAFNVYKVRHVADTAHDLDD